MSELVIVALASEDGWAMVRSGDQLLLLKPPFLRDGTRLIREIDVAIAVQRQGFVVSDESFDGWGDLVSYLSQKYSDAAARRRQLIGSSESDVNWSTVPIQVVATLLDKIGNELVASSDFGTAGRLLSKLLSNPCLKSDAPLLQRTHDLVTKCLQEDGARKTRTETSSPFAGIAAADVAARIASRGAVWAMGS